MELDDVWQDIYRAAVGRTANAEEAFPPYANAEESIDLQLHGGAVLPPDVPSTTDLFSLASASLHDGELPCYERSESLRSLAWRQRKDHRFCQLPPIGDGEEGEGRPRLMMRLVPPKIPPSVMR